MMDETQFNLIDNAERTLRDLSASRTAARRVNQDIDDDLRSLCCDLIAEVGMQSLSLDHANEILDKLPKCWRLVDGKLVQDVPVVPEMTLWVVGDYGDGQMIRQVEIYRISLLRGDSDAWNWMHHDSYDSREAAEFAKAATTKTAKKK